MKSIIIIIAVILFATGLTAQDSGLIKYVPGDVDGFGHVNLKEFSSNPRFKDFVEKNQDPKFNQFKDNLKLNGIDIYNAFSSGLFYFNSKSKKGGAILKTSITENTFNSMLANNMNNNGKVNKTSANGKTVYSVDNGGRKSSFVYLKPDIIGVSELPEDVSALASMTEKESATSNVKLMDYTAKANKNSMIWFVYDAKDSFTGMRQKNAEGNKGMQQLFPIDNIQGGFMNLNLAGQNKDNINIDTHINCRDKNKAQMLAMWIQPMLMSYISVISQGNSQLNDALLDAIKFSNEGHDIIIKADINPALQEQMKKSTLDFSANPFQTQLAGAKRKREVKAGKPSSDADIGLPPPPATR